MTTKKICLPLIVLVTGCTIGPQAKVMPAVATATQPIASIASEVELINHEFSAEELVQPVDFYTPVTGELVIGSSLTLDVIESMALSNSPAIKQASSRVRALRGKFQQVGLSPNPTVGYMGSEIGNEGRAGQQGAFISQEIVTAGKLQRNRAIVAAEMSQAEQELVAMQQRVRTDVRQQFYQALMAQRRVQLAKELVGLTTEVVTASKTLLDAQEIPLAGLLQTEVQQQNSELLLRTAENQLDQAWRNLAAVVGDTDFIQSELTGQIKELPIALGWEEQLIRLQSESPEVAAALAEIERARRALSRACVEPVPNINTQWSVQYDYATEDTVAGVQVGIALPIWNRNQGAIRQAQAEVSQATSNIQRLELDLQQRLSNAFCQYADANMTATAYANEILPRTKQTLNLVRAAYEQGEVSYLELLTAQKTFSETNLAYLDALGSLWTSYTHINGMLLDQSLRAGRP